MNHGNRETERTVTMRITVPVYGMVEHVNKLVDRVQRILSLSFADIKVEQVEIEIDDPDQLTFDHG